MPGETGAKLVELIKKAIDDLVLTQAEYEQILALVQEDGVIDAQERQLLDQLQNMIESGIIKRTAG